MVPVSQLLHRALFRLYWMGIVHRAVWIHLVQVIAEWNIISWVKKERTSLQAIFFWSLEKRVLPNTEQLELDNEQNAEGQWIFGALLFWMVAELVMTYGYIRKLELREFPMIKEK